MQTALPALQLLVLLSLTAGFLASVGSRRLSFSAIPLLLIVTFGIYLLPSGSIAAALPTWLSAAYPKPYLLLMCAFAFGVGWWVGDLVRHTAALLMSVMAGMIVLFLVFQKNALVLF